MNTESMQKCFEKLLKRYFAKAQIRWGYTDLPKPVCPFLMLTLGPVHRDIFPIDDGNRNYLCSGTITVDLYTPGRKLPAKTGRTAPQSFNTAVSDLQSFLNYLYSEEGLAYMEEYSISILPQGDTLDMSQLLNDVSYEYRAHQEFKVNYMDITRGYAGITPPPGETFEESPSGGGTKEQADSQIGWFDSVDLKGGNHE